MFERLLLNRINKIESGLKVDLTGESQHGFKKGKSTATASMSIQMTLSNRLNILNGRINYKWLNKSLESYKFKC